MIILKSKTYVIATTMTLLSKVISLSRTHIELLLVDSSHVDARQPQMWAGWSQGRLQLSKVIKKSDILSLAQKTFMMMNFCLIPVALLTILFLLHVS